MNCTETRQAIDQLPLHSEPNGNLTDHLNTCELCRHYHSDHLLALELESLDVPEPTDEFLNRAMKLAMESHAAQTSSPVNRWRWPAAMAASVLVAAVGFMGFWESAPVPQKAPAAEPATAQTEYHRETDNHREEVRIVIYSSEDHENAELSIQLAENLELDGYAGRQQLTWSTPLSKGANVLKVPVLVRDNGGEVHVVSHFAGKSHEVRVQVTKRDNTSPSEAENTPRDRLQLDVVG